MKKDNSQDTIPAEKFVKQTVFRQPRKTLYPGSIFNQTYSLKPLAQVCKQERGLALDAMLSKEIDETNLASSSLAETGDPNDLLGIVVSYSVKVTLRLSGMGGKLEVDLPFKLNHPKPGKS